MEQTTITPAKRTYVGQEITFKLAYSRTTSKGLLKNISSDRPGILLPLTMLKPS